MKFILLILTLVLAAAAPVSAQSDSTPWATSIGTKYWVQPDVVYATANNTQLKLDIWYQHESKKPQPTLVYIHGGGWIFGGKTYSILHYLPFLEKGWRVVDVQYRLASNSSAPAAVEDTRCALRWVFDNARQWKFDTSKIVLTGHSAGGHLALITGILPDGTPLDNNCYSPDPLPKPAAVINWYGISDVNDLIAGPNIKNYAVMWMGSGTNAAERAKSVSPLTYIREGLPPIISIHGDKDDVVPYSHSTRLHNELDRVKVKNELFTVKGGGHGQFKDSDYVASYSRIWRFLKDIKVTDR